MTEDQFFNEALLRIASNSAFGSHRRSSYQSFDEWAKDIKEAASALTEIAIECNTLDEPDKPP